MSKETAKKDQPQQAFFIDQLYVKECAFTANQPINQIAEGWEPKVDINIDTVANKLQDEIWEVTLKVKVTVANHEQTIFTTMADQSGAFTMKGFSDEQMSYLQNCHCPTILFPYARELISNMVSKGGYPALYLSPVDFEQRYRSMQQEAEKS